MEPDEVLRLSQIGGLAELFQNGNSPKPGNDGTGTRRLPFGLDVSITARSSLSSILKRGFSGVIAAMARRMRTQSPATAVWPDLDLDRQRAA